MKILTIFLISLFSIAISSDISKFAAIENAIDANVQIISSEIGKWVETGHQSDKLKNMISMLSFPDTFQESKWRSLPRTLHSCASCIVCRSVASSVIKMRRKGTDDSTIISTISSLCSQLNLASKRVCEGVVELNMPIILYIIDTKANFTTQDFCGVILQNESCAIPSDKFNWTISVDTRPSSHIQYEETSDTYQVIQLSDIHYDPKYEPYGNPQCEDRTCCRIGQNETNNNNNELAGYWGDYNNCDTPWHSVVETFNHVQNSHQNETYIYFTGDIIDHGVWETTRELNTESIIQVYNKMKHHFPTKIIYPILGNHEAHPMNMFAPSSVTNDTISVRWLYNLVADLWISYGWLPESTRSTLLRGGFYTVVPKKGFRIIALNNNVCYIYNWWILYEPNDPDGQLKWLSETLLLAEKQGEFVHILAHVPPGSKECLGSWSRAYKKIVNRFAHIIAAEFNGHTHYDELRVYYDLEKRNEAIGVAWNGGSVTTYSFLNPNYRVYDVNINNYNVEDVRTWIYNLTHANLSPHKAPEWKVSYSFKQEYGLKDLSMSSLDNWLHKLINNESLALQYHSNYVTYAEPSIKYSCNPTCIKEIICSIVITDFTDKEDCKRFSKNIKNHSVDDDESFLKLNEITEETWKGNYFKS